MLKRIFSDDFLKNNIIFFIGSMAVAVLNYLYHPILGRMMSVADFGEVQALISLFMQLGIFTGIFNIITINITANYEDREERDKLISSLRKISFAIAGFLFLLIIAGSSVLQDFFHFSSIYPFISLAFLIIFGVSLTFRKAFLQGQSDFQAVSWTGIISAGAKLGFAVLFVYAGWRSLGAISALLIAQALALFYAYAKTRHSLNLSLFAEKGLATAFKSEYKYALLIFLATSAITFLYTADVLMIKHWFSPEEAGLYSGIATIARIIFFATGSVCGVLLASIKTKNSPELNKRILQKALVLIGLIAGGAFLLFSFFSEAIINILIGSRYASMAPLLGKLSLLLAMVSVINLLFSYFLALRRTIIIGAALAGPATIIILSLLHHDSPERIIYNFLVGSAVVLAVLFKGIFIR